jgi:hypothetical protein
MSDTVQYMVTFPSTDEFPSSHSRTYRRRKEDYSNVGNGTRYMISIPHANIQDLGDLVGNLPEVPRHSYVEGDIPINNIDMPTPRGPYGHGIIGGVVPPNTRFGIGAMRHWRSA